MFFGRTVHGKHGSTPAVPERATEPGLAVGSVFAALVPIAAVVGLATYAMVFALTRVSGLGSLLGLVALGVAVVVTGDRPALVLYLASSTVVVWRHRKNLQEYLEKRRAQRARQ